MKNLKQLLREPQEFYFTERMTAEGANALYTSLLQDGADAIEKLEAENAQLKAELAAMHSRSRTPVAYITETEQGPMVWTPEMYGEACTYCDDGEFPLPLVKL